MAEEKHHCLICKKELDCPTPDSETLHYVEGFGYFHDACAASSVSKTEIQAEYLKQLELQP